MFQNASLTLRGALVGGLAALLLLLPVAARGLAAEPTLVPPTVIEPRDGTSVAKGTHVNFAVRTFPGDDMLWVHISRSTATDECGVVDGDVHTYGLDPTADPSVYRTDTTLYTFEGFWMVTPATYYWQAYRIEHGFDADGCIETPIQRLTIGSGGPVAPEKRPSLPKAVSVKQGKPLLVTFKFPSPAKVTTTLKKGTKTIVTVKKATQPGKVKVTVPAKSRSYCPLARAAATSCPLPKGNYKLKTKIVSKTTGNKFRVTQAVKITSVRG